MTERRKFDYLFAGGGSGGGGLSFGTIVSVDCDARTLVVDLTHDGTCAEQQVDVIDPLDIIGRTSLVYGLPLSVIQGSACIVTKLKRISDCVELWLLIDIGGYTDCDDT